MRPALAVALLTVVGCAPRDGRPVPIRVHADRAAVELLLAREATDRDVWARWGRAMAVWVPIAVLAAAARIEIPGPRMPLAIEVALTVADVDTGRCARTWPVSWGDHAWTTTLPPGRYRVRVDIDGRLGRWRGTFPDVNVPDEAVDVVVAPPGDT